MTAADIIAAHESYDYAGAVACICSQLEFDNTHAHAQHVLDALKAEGYELVQLPDPEPREDGEDEVGSQWERVGEFRVTVWDEYPDEVALSYDFEPYEPFTPAEARSLAAALLAAANRVEGESK